MQYYYSRHHAKRLSWCLLTERWIMLRVIFLGSSLLGIKVISSRFGSEMLWILNPTGISSCLVLAHISQIMTLNAS